MGYQLTCLIRNEKGILSECRPAIKLWAIIADQASPSPDVFLPDRQPGLGAQSSDLRYQQLESVRELDRGRSQLGNHQDCRADQYNNQVVRR